MISSFLYVACRHLVATSDDQVATKWRHCDKNLHTENDKSLQIHNIKEPTRITNYL